MNMVYGEWLRVRKGLKLVAIIFGILIVLAFLLRVVVAQFGGYDTIVKNMASDPGTKIVHVVLPDGTHRTIMDNPKDHSHIVVDDKGYAGKSIVITEPSTHQKQSHDHVMVGSFQVGSSMHGNITTTTINTDGPTSISTLIANALFVAFILATALGTPFARENSGHLEIALTKPIGRIALALQMMGMDAIGIIAGFFISVVGEIAISAIFQTPHIVFDANAWPWFSGGLLLALVWYALLTAATASLKRGHGAVLGFAWPAAVIIAVLRQFNFGDSILGQTLQFIIRVLAFFDPIAYLNATNTDKHILGASSVVWMPIVVGLLIVYTGAAVIQWRRVEA